MMLLAADVRARRESRRRFGTFNQAARSHTFDLKLTRVLLYSVCLCADCVG